MNRCFFEQFVPNWISIEPALILLNRLAWVHFKQLGQTYYDRWPKLRNAMALVSLNVATDPMTMLLKNSPRENCNCGTAQLDGMWSHRFAPLTQDETWAGTPCPCQWNLIHRIGGGGVSLILCYFTARPVLSLDDYIFSRMSRLLVACLSLDMCQKRIEA